MIIAVVPVKRLSEAKHRLAARLTAAERVDLVLWLLDRMLAATAAASLVDETIVVTPDPEVALAAQRRGACVLHQTGSGLNRAILLGRDEATRRGADAMLIALGDLPFLTAGDVDELARMADDATVAVAPDRHERGTNGLALSPVDVIDPAFGPGSLDAHRSAARSRGVAVREYRALGTCFDLDTPDDLDEFHRIQANGQKEASWRGQDASH